MKAFFVSLHPKVMDMTKLGGLFAALLAGVLITGCSQGAQHPKAYVSELTGSDSVSLHMGQWTLLKYHSDRLSLDINYPSYLVHQDLPDEVGLQELFMMDDVSVSVMVDSLRDMTHSPGQTLMAMGADLAEVGDDYSIQEGVDDKWEYYGKVIESDSLRLITVMLRYYPEHADAVEQLKEWVRNFKVK